MEIGQPSKTAYSAARYRAAHQILENGSIFKDPLAVRILGADEEELRADAPRRAMRAFVTARSRFAEDALAASVRNGMSQLVILGAGLDTFAYRNPHPGLHVYEVDHPDTQAWKRNRLTEAGIAIPDSVTYLGVDFERDELTVDGPAFYFWLGVVPYLTRDAFDRTIAAIARTRGNEVVFDYAMSPESMPPERRAALEARADRVARLGEPWLTYFDPPAIAADLREIGFGGIEDLGPSRMAARFFGRDDVPPETPGGHLLHATVS